jgi:hypothetical protein
MNVEFQGWPTYIFYYYEDFNEYINIIYDTDLYKKLKKLDYMENNIINTVNNINDNWEEITEFGVFSSACVPYFYKPARSTKDYPQWLNINKIEEFNTKRLQFDSIYNKNKIKMVSKIQNWFKNIYYAPGNTGYKLAKLNFANNC